MKTGEGKASVSSRPLERFAEDPIPFVRILKYYKTADPTVRMKAGFFLALCVVILIILPVAIVNSIVIQLNNPAFGNRIHPLIILPEIGALVLFSGVLLLLLHGRFGLSSNLILIILNLTVWTVMFLDRTSAVSRMDTIAFVYAVLVLSSMAFTERGYVIFFYGALNIAALFLFGFLFRNDFAIPADAFQDFLSDNSIVIVFVTITAYCIFAINRRALNRVRIELEEHRRAEVSLSLSEDKYRALVENINEAIFETDRNGTFTFISPRVQSLFGMSPDSIIGRPYSDFVEREDLPRMTERLQRLSEGLSKPDEYRMRNARGEYYWVRISSIPMIEDGRLAGVRGVLSDVTELKAAEESLRDSLREKEALIRELHHRTKNNMQIISSLLSLHSSTLDDPRVIRVLSDMKDRIHSMALVHEKLYRSGDLSRIDMGDYIVEIGTLLLQSYAVSSERISIVYDVDDLSFPVDAAIPCGLILNELISNSLKYAFPGEERGEIRVALHRTEDGAAELRIADNGKRLPADFDFRKNRKMGLETVLGLVEQQLRGEIAFDVSHGSSCVIRFSEGSAEDAQH